MNKLFGREMPAQVQEVRVETEVRTYSLEEVEQELINLREGEDATHWKYGDVANIIIKEFGSKELGAIAKRVGIPVKTMRRYGNVAKHYTPEQREEYPKLSFSHYKEVAALPNRMELLKEADDKNWSVEKLSIMAHGLDEDENGDPESSDAIVDDNVPPQPPMLYDRNCQRWYFEYPEDAKRLCPSEGNCMETK